MMSANAPSLLHCGNGRSVLGPPRPSRPAALASGRLAGYTATAPAGRRAQHVGVHLQSTSPGAHLGKAQPPRAAVSARAVASAAAPALPGAAELVCIAYADLESGVDLSAELERAYGPAGLGILIVSGVPGFQEKRSALLPLADAFAHLPDEAKRECEDPSSHYNVGWSHGQEALSSGRPDVLKGSYYANPRWDTLAEASEARRRAAEAGAGPGSVASTSGRQPGGGAAASRAALGSGDDDCAELARYPGYFARNRWPTRHLPSLEPSFKGLGGLMCDVGELIMQQCDRYVAGRLGTQRGWLATVLRRSRNPKARLLHYFAAPASPARQQQQQQHGAAEEPAPEHEQAWCGWHYDHGSLTGLTSAMYCLNSGGEVRQVPNPDPVSGLYIRDRHGRVVKANIPPDCIAFQVGEALQVHSGGLLRATPHYVRAAQGPAAAGISRNTFAVFMQPDVEEPMACPQGVPPEQVAIGQWQPGQTFGQFAEATFSKYYGQAA